MTELLVIGGGMAGAIAALSAQRAGAKVLLARRALGATAMSSGAIDVAADPYAPPGDLEAHAIPYEEAARKIARHNRHHPYAVLEQKLGRLPEALRFAAEQLADLLPPPGDRNVLLPTVIGTVKPSALAQRTQWGGHLSALSGTVAVVELGVNPLWDARLIAAGLEEAAAKLGRKLNAVPVRNGYFRWTEDATRHPYELAERLEVSGALEDFAERLGRELPPASQSALLPPMVGRRHGLIEKLSELVRLPCVELLSTAPSVPGIRLQEALDRALAKVGIEVVEEEVQPESKAADAFRLGGRGSFRPDSVVLATGKFIGGGIERRTRFREAVFDLPVFSRGMELKNQYIGELLGPEMIGEHDAFRAGIRIDASLRPLQRDGSPYSSRLFAAGSVIGGYDPAVDKTGLGVAIFTGYLAGEEACRAANACPEPAAMPA